LREKYIDEWQPRNVLESQMIDSICQAQTIREYWMTLATERVAVECEIERYWVEVRGIRCERRIDGSESAREAREEAERWDRVFIRSVRALRDLRRYTTALIVNNKGGQVNVATDESRQVNLVKRSKKKRPPP
jgi:ribosomal protein S26